MKLLIVDDEPDFLANLLRALEKIGHTAIGARGGEEGWELLAADENEYDAILTDIKMSRLDGIEFLKRIRESENEVPVVLMTGHGDLELAIQAVKLGAFDFILKPFTLQELDTILKKIQSFVVSRHDLQQLSSVMTLEGQLAIPSRRGLIPGVITLLKHQYLPNCEKHHLSTRLIDLCLNESLVNAVIHGNLEVDSSLKSESWDLFEKQVAEREALDEYGGRMVKIRFAQNPRMLRFTVEDQGRGFDAERQLHAMERQNSDISTFGRGLAMINSIMDEVFWNDAGNSITFVKNFADEQSPSTEMRK